MREVATFWLQTKRATKELSFLVMSARFLGASVLVPVVRKYGFDSRMESFARACFHIRTHKLGGNL